MLSHALRRAGLANRLRMHEPCMLCRPACAQRSDQNPHAVGLPVFRAHGIRPPLQTGGLVA